MMKVQACEIYPGISKRVQITLADMAPIIEFDAQFERPTCLANKLIFIQSKYTIQAADLRDRRFANAHCANGFRFDQRNFDGAS